MVIFYDYYRDSVVNKDGVSSNPANTLPLTRITPFSSANSTSSSSNPNAENSTNVTFSLKPAAFALDTKVLYAPNPMGFLLNLHSPNIVWIRPFPSATLATTLMSASVSSTLPHHWPRSMTKELI